MVDGDSMSSTKTLFIAHLVIKSIFQRCKLCALI